MKPKRPPITDEVELYTHALNLLSKKSRSRWEMRRLLARRCERDALIESVLDKCVARGYLDDVKYAVQLARVQTERKRHGRRRVAQELRARGLAEDIIDQTLQEIFSSLDEMALLQKAIESKLRHWTRPLNRQKIKKMYDQLVRAGFDTDLIVRALRKLRIPVPAGAATSEEETC